jgi:hypothetical protein
VGVSSYHSLQVAYQVQRLGKAVDHDHCDEVLVKHPSLSYLPCWLIPAIDLASAGRVALMAIRLGRPEAGGSGITT